jgi:GDP-L-fucose synthase
LNKRPKNKNIFLAGHNGMVGKHLRFLLDSQPNVRVITVPRDSLDLTNQQQVSTFFEKNSFDEVYIAAARVGGIFDNKTHPADFIYQNLMIQTNIIHSAHLANIDKLLFLGSSCIYPRDSKQPIKEEYLLTSQLEDSNLSYAIAKIAGLKLCSSYNKQFSRDYRCLMPTNLYGRFDNFNLDSSHVIPGLIAKFYIAQSNSRDRVDLWGSGKPLREFLHVTDLAKACIDFMDMDKEDFYKHGKSSFEHINIGSGEELSINDLAIKISSLLGYKGKIFFDTSKPDGTPRKLLDSSRAKKIGFNPSISLDEGLEDTISWFLNNAKIQKYF